jgi:hypothetical protein
MKKPFTEFELGWLAAAATSERAFDCGVQTMELLRAVGVCSVRQLRGKGLEEYDEAPLIRALTGKPIKEQA